jgi:hypothetical protein
MLAERGMLAGGECLPASVEGECPPASVGPLFFDRRLALDAENAW